ncbi:MAG: FAD-dependent oxidoreductase [Firmicutes bacterium]|nr:FAD-dependent oxidoreductase [Bacillota bacterium]
MARVVVVGGGWAGCAAALSARQAGSQVTLLERTDLLLGAGLVGGIMLNNGRLTAALESKALGGGLIFEALEGIYRHRKIDFPGHKHASLYDIIKVEPLIRRLLRENGVDIRLQSRIVGVEQAAARVEGVILATGDTIAGDAFVDATGTSGPPGHCWRYGHGCALCAQRCHAFGPRMSVVKMAGKKEYPLKKPNGSFGAMSGSCKLCPESLSPEIRRQLRTGGVAVIPLPKQLVRPEKLKLKVCQQYALDEYAANIVLLDTGSVKMMAPFIPLSALKKVPGFEQARYLDPLAGGIGNSMRLLAMAYRDDSLKVDGLDNLFVAGEKQGPAVGHTEAIVTGTLAGHNAVRHAVGQKLLVLPSTLALGALVRAISSDLENNQPGRQSYTFAGAVFFQTMVERNLYDTDPKKVAARVDAAGLSGIYRRPLPS